MAAHHYHSSYKVWSLKALFLMVTLCAVVVEFALLLGPALSLLGSLCVAANLTAAFLSKRLRLAALVLSVAFCAVPWTGASGCLMEYPGYGPLPVPRLPRPGGAFVQTIRIVVEPLYRIAALPLEMSAGVSDDMHAIVCFTGDCVATVRPFIVFFFWGSISISLVLRILIEAIRSPRECKRGRSNEGT